MVAVIVLAAVFIVAPRLAAPWVHERVVAAIDASVHGRASFEAFALGWPAHVTAGGFALKDETGEPVVEVAALEASIDLWGLLRGRYDVELRLVAPAVRLRQDEEGRWSLGELFGREAEDDENKGPDAEPVPEAEDPAPELDLRLDVSSASIALQWPDGDPTVIGLDVLLDVSTAQLDCTIERVEVRSELGSGRLAGRVRNLRAWSEDALRARVTFEELEGEFAYRPEPVGELLARWLPVTLSGQEEQRIAFRIVGSVDRPDLASFLSGTILHADIGLGRFETTGLDCVGSLGLEGRDGRFTWNGELAANGGELELEGEVDLRDADRPRTTLRVVARDVEANARLSPLLSALHPVFAGLETLQRSEIGGRIQCDLELSYAGPLTGEVVASGWDAFPKERLEGGGSFEIRAATVRGTPALEELLGFLGVDATRTLDVRPIVFNIERGRVSYAQPWTWTIDGVETTFTGSVGLDRTLDLRWNLPVTEELIEEHHLLEPLRGDVIRIPITGTARRPKIEWQETFRDLATRTARDEVLEALGIGGGEGEDPGTLLKEADRLWEEGSKLEAAEIYRRIRKEYKLSLVYALHRDKIKRRGKHRE